LGSLPTSGWTQVRSPVNFFIRPGRLPWLTEVSRGFGSGRNRTQRFWLVRGFTPPTVPDAEMDLYWRRSGGDLSKAVSDFPAAAAGSSLAIITDGLTEQQLRDLAGGTLGRNITVRGQTLRVAALRHIDVRGGKRRAFYTATDAPAALACADISLTD